MGHTMRAPSTRHGTHTHTHVTHTRSTWGTIPRGGRNATTWGSEPDEGSQETDRPVARHALVRRLDVDLNAERRILERLWLLLSLP
eukprot:2752714-Rhodomonas_salina.1